MCFAETVYTLNISVATLTQLQSSVCPICVSCTEIDQYNQVFRIQKYTQHVSGRSFLPLFRTLLHLSKEKVLMFNTDLRNTIKKACSYDSEALRLEIKAAQLIGCELFQSNSSSDGKFAGRFANECQENFVPSTPKALVSLIVNGSDSIEQTASPFKSQAVLSISKIIAYNRQKQLHTSSTAGLSYLSDHHLR